MQPTQQPNQQPNHQPNQQPNQQTQQPKQCTHAYTPNWDDTIMHPRVCFDRVSQRAYATGFCKTCNADVHSMAGASIEYAIESMNTTIYSLQFINDLIGPTLKQQATPLVTEQPSTEQPPAEQPPTDHLTTEQPPTEQPSTDHITTVTSPTAFNSQESNVDAGPTTQTPCDRDSRLVEYQDKIIQLMIENNRLMTENDELKHHTCQSKEVCADEASPNSQDKVIQLLTELNELRLVNSDLELKICQLREACVASDAAYAALLAESS